MTALTAFPWTTLATALALLLYSYMGIRVAKAHQTYGITPPAMTGNADFERIYRVQMNTTEWLPIFLPVLWLFAVYHSDKIAAFAGLVWTIGRILYMNGYIKEAGKRSLGFSIQAFVCLFLLAGVIVGAVRSLIG